MVDIMQYEVLYIMIILLESSEIQDGEKLGTVNYYSNSCITLNANIRP